MATVIRAELSEKNKYWIDKHRHYELKHFCLQYPQWKKLYFEADGFGRNGIDETGSRSNLPGDPTAKCVDIREGYRERIQMIEWATDEADPGLASYILKAVTEGLSYPQLKSRLGIPCSRDTYYDRYRKFFWTLDKLRR